MRRARANALAGLALLLGSCVEYDEVPAGAYPGIAEMSEFVPTVALEVDGAEFAEMIERYGEDLEVEADVTLWREGRIALRSAPSRLKVKGRFSTKFPLKSLGIKLDRDATNEDRRLLRVPYVKPSDRVDVVRALRLRNGGNEFVGTLVKDLAFARLVAASDLRVVPVYGEPAATFVNGAFYGLHNLRTEHNASGLSRLLGVRKRQLRIASVVNEGPVAVKSGPVAFWRELEAAIAAGDTAAVFAAIDEDSFIDFVVGGVIFGSYDWPHGNVRMVSVDGAPIRFVLFDFDLACRYHVTATPHEHLSRGPDNPIRRMLDLCRGRTRFRQRLEGRYAEVLAGGALGPDRLRRELATLARAFDPVIAHQTSRYGYPASRGQWYTDLEALAEEYERRYDRLDGSW